MMPNLPIMISLLIIGAILANKIIDEGKEIYQPYTPTAIKAKPSDILIAFVKFENGYIYHLRFFWIYPCYKCNSTKLTRAGDSVVCCDCDAKSSALYINDSVFNWNQRYDLYSQKEQTNG